MEQSHAKILVVDDIEDNLEILGDLLSINGYDVHIAMSGESALKQVQALRPDLILLDVLMPQMDGYQVCARLKNDEDTNDIPVIFVSSMTDLESKVKGFQAGGVDYIEKPFQFAEILVRVNTHVTLVQLRKHLEAQNAELERLANTDHLTELYNRRRFFNVAETEFAQAIQKKKHFAVTLIDVDYFKRVNDHYGHLVGDSVLKHIAQTIRSQARICDITARYGGEEFVILHPLIDSQDAYIVAERIRSGVEASPFLSEFNEIKVTLSAGVADTFLCQERDRLDDLLARADRALYQAKREGRNKVVVLN